MKSKFLSLALSLAVAVPVVGSFAASAAAKDTVVVITRDSHVHHPTPRQRHLRHVRREIHHDRRELYRAQHHPRYAPPAPRPLYRVN